MKENMELSLGLADLWFRHTAPTYAAAYTPEQLTTHTFSIKIASIFIENVMDCK